MATLAAVVGRTLDDPAVVEFFLTQPATARRRGQGRIDLNGIRSLSSKELGYVIDHRKGRIEVVFLYLCAKDGYAAFPGELIGELCVSDSREDVRRKLGPPTLSGPVTRRGCGFGIATTPTHSACTLPTASRGKGCGC